MGKKSAPPPPPDYKALAEQTAKSSNEQLALQTEANRPNRETAYGSERWAQDPAGKWTQTTTLNPAEQAQLDANRGIQRGLTNTAGGLLGQAQTSLQNPLSTAGLPAWQGYDPSKLASVDPNQIAQGLPARGTAPVSGPMAGAPIGGQFDMSARGNNKDIQDAWMSRIAPARELARGSEIQRLKNQGITENSDAWTRAIRRLDEGDTDAQNQALIHGTQEYGNEFQRGLAGNAQNYGQNLTSAGFTNQAQNQRFGQDMQGADFANHANQQQFGQNVQLQSMLAALRGQQFNEQGAQAALTGNQRAAMLTEAQALRQSPLNDLRSLMGANPNNPAFAQFTNASLGKGADYYGAGKDAYTEEMNSYNAKQKRSSDMLGGLMGMGGMALGGPMGGALGGMLAKSMSGG